MGLLHCADWRLTFAILFYQLLNAVHAGGRAQEYMVADQQHKGIIPHEGFRLPYRVPESFRLALRNQVDLHPKGLRQLGVAVRIRCMVHDPHRVHAGSGQFFKVQPDQGHRPPITVRDRLEGEVAMPWIRGGDDSFHGRLLEATTPKIKAETNGILFPARCSSSPHGWKVQSETSSPGVSWQFKRRRWWTCCLNGTPKQFCILLREHETEPASNF